MTSLQIQWKTIRRLLAVAWMGIVFAPDCIAEEGEWKVGLAQATITPTEPLWLAGYTSRNHASTGVLDDLLAQAALFEDGEGNRSLLLTVDLCVLRTQTVDDLCRRIAGATGLSREKILVNMSHTHSGPAVDLCDGSMYAIPAADKIKLVQYTETVKQTLTNLAVSAVADLKPARLAYGVGEAKFFENRRVLDASGNWVAMGPNRSNHTDRDVPVLKIASPSGDVRAVLFGAACHNVTLGDNYEISGDYASYARRTIQEAFPGAQAMFVTGCGADANPEPRAGADAGTWVVRHGESLGTEVVRVLGEPMSGLGGGIRTRFEMVDLPLETGMTRAEIEQIANTGAGWDRHVAGLMLAALDRGETLPTTYAAPIAAWALGDSLMLVGLPEETVSEYVPLLKDQLGAEGLWTAGYCNDVSGYMPTVNILNQGGYETRGLFGPDIGWFAPEVETAVVGKVREMAISLGRPLPVPGGPYAAPIGWWRQEPGAFLSDSSEEGANLVTNHGVAVESSETCGESSKACGRFGGDDYLEGTNGPGFNGAWDGLTLAAWIRPTQTGLNGIRVICGKWANTVENDHYLLFLADGKPGIAVADGATGENGFISGTALTPGEWHFVVGTWDRKTGRYRLFVDEADPLTGYQGGSGLNTESNQTFKIGAEAVAGYERYFDGLIDDVWLFDTAIGAGAVAQLRQGKYYWTLLDGDLNGDGLVGSGDLDVVRSNWGQRVPAGDRLQGDPSGDGVVDSADLNIVRSNWGATVASIPEPGASVLLSCGFVGIIAQRAVSAGKRSGPKPGGSEYRRERCEFRMEDSKR